MHLSLRRRTDRRIRRGRLRARLGVSLVEILVAVTLFGTVAIAMGGLSLVVARRADANDVFTKRTALLQQQMNWLQALPYDSLAEKAGTVLIAHGAFPHERTISLEPNATGSRVRVTIEIVPTRAPRSRETIVFDRARPTTSPLCSGC